MKELTRIIPNSTPLWRKNASIKKTVKQAIANGYTDIMVINEDNRMPNGLVVTHLPEGPTAHFKLSNVKITKDIKRDWREITSHRPEVILNNFTTRLGKVFQKIFPVKSQCTVQDSVILTFFSQYENRAFRGSYVSRSISLRPSISWKTRRDLPQPTGLHILQTS